METYIFASFCVGICMIMPHLGISIASFTIAGLNVNNTCNTTIIEMRTWVFVNGAVEMFMASYMLMLLIIMCIAKSNKIIKKPFLAINGVYTLFVLAWNIIGSIILFRDNSVCRFKGVMIASITLAGLIFQWVMFFFNWCAFQHREDEDDK